MVDSLIWIAGLYLPESILTPASVKQCPCQTWGAIYLNTCRRSFIEYTGGSVTFLSRLFEESDADQRRMRRVWRFLTVRR
ncbi:MAG: hypothetical protein SGJ09_17880 [Phycisphaerae bacterium]|nr:hypothetical protein [Phycisphaerae bacterium]